MILGIDEVGRGPWAGPLVVAAVVLGDTTIDGLTDSKKLTKRKRDELDIIIREQAAGYGLGWVYAEEIDQIGLSAALREATKRAVQQVKVPYHQIIIDGTVNFLADTTKGQYVTTMKKADLLISAVSAASIIAKVARDNYMTEQAKKYKEYGFESHVGYGTAKHALAIEQNGVTPLHRLSFAPLARFRRSDAVGSATTKAIGAAAEDKVAAYLSKRRHKVLERNWKTRFCEIDIVSQHSGVVYFTEVKYRKTANQGGGMAAITAKKLDKMKFAAEVYVKAHKLQNTDILLAVATVIGPDLEIEQWLELH